MKSFLELLVESKKTYLFKIGIAGDVPSDVTTQLKSALAKYEIIKLSTGKKTPIQLRPLDFPQLQNLEVTYYDVELGYPTTPQVLAEYLGNYCDIHRSYIVVRNPNEPLELYQAQPAQDIYDTLLTNEELGGTSAQAQVGGNRVMELLKELEKARSEREHDAAKAAPAGESADIDTNENTKSPIGS